MYTTTTKNLLSIYKFFRDNPDGCISTGMWDEPAWDKSDFDRWLMICLDKKINKNDERTGQRFTDDYTNDLCHDVRTIRDYCQSHVRSTGSCNVLHLPEMKMRYPYINNQREKI